MYKRQTAAGALHLFAGVFGAEAVQVEARGNAVAGLGFWTGLAQEDVTRADLEPDDPDFPCIVTVRAVKR